MEVNQSNITSRTSSDHSDMWEMIQQKRASLELKAKQTEEEKQTLLEAQKAILDERFAQLKEDKRVLDEEKASMIKEIVSDDDIIQLNVGGDNFNARRDTLCLCKDSLLASMFSGRWEESLPKLQDGRFFLDYDPECFKQILNRLREMRLTQSCTFPLPIQFQSSQQQKDFFMLAKYLGVLPENQDKIPQDTIPHFEPNPLVATSNGERSQTLLKIKETGHVFLQTPVLKFVSTNPIFWKVQIQQLYNWVFIGIISRNTHGNNSYNSITSYGWGGQTVYVKGFGENRLGGWDCWKVHDEATISLDPVSRTLKMSHKRESSVRTFQIDVGVIPKAGWRLHVNLTAINDKIEVSTICAHEMFS